MIEGKVTLGTAPGYNIFMYARALVEAARKYGEAEGRFNDMIIKADRTTTVEDIMGSYAAAVEDR